MYYRHNLSYEYPAQSDQHMIHVPHLWDVNLDENYPYLQKGPWFALQRGFMWVVLHFLLFPLLTGEVPTLEFIITATVPFNVLKAVVISAITYFVYKPLSPVLHGRR